MNQPALYIQPGFYLMPCADLWLLAALSSVSLKTNKEKEGKGTKAQYINKGNISVTTAYHALAGIISTNKAKKPDSVSFIEWMDIGTTVPFL